jgi:NAD(P)-dependent dehydrogenase (short-subunit alcohol dehydrogenase family)
MKTSLKNKWVLITGASSGFGAAAAKAFGAEGAKLLLGARRIDRLEKPPPPPKRPVRPRCFFTDSTFPIPRALKISPAGRRKN